MKTTKNVFTSHILDASANAGIGKADPLPTIAAPKTPKDFVPSKAAHGSKVQPLPDVIKAAAPAANEIGGSKTYAADFGAGAPDPTELATNVAFAAAWSAQLALAENWFLYTKEQTRLAWQQANPQLDDFAPAFAYARGHNDAIATQYASTAKLFDARSQPAVKGAAVKASKKATTKTAARKAAKAAAAATTPAPETPAETAPAAKPATTTTTTAAN